MLKNDKTVERVLKTYRISESTVEAIDKRSKLLGMNIGEYIEYVVARESLPNKSYNATMENILSDAYTIKDQIFTLFRSLEREHLQSIKKDSEPDLEEVDRWLSIIVKRIESGDVESYDELYRLIRHGTEKYNLSDYAVSIMENAYNKGIPIRK